MVAALLAMKAIRDLKLPDQKRPPHRRHRRGDRFPGHQVVLRQSPLCPHTPVPDADFPHHQPGEGALPAHLPGSPGPRRPPCRGWPPFRRHPAEHGAPQGPGHRPGPPPRQGGGEAFQALAFGGGGHLHLHPGGGGPHGPAPGRTPTAPPPEEGHNAQTALVALAAPCPWQTAPLPGPSGPSTPSFPPRGPQGHRPGHRPGGRPVRPPDPGPYHAPLNDTGCTRPV